MPFGADGECDKIYDSVCNISAGTGGNLYYLKIFLAKSNFFNLLLSAKFP